MFGFRWLEAVVHNQFKVILVTIIGTLCAASVFCSTAFAAEIATCNANTVKQVIINGTFEKLKAAGVQIYSAGAPGPRTPAILAAFEKWSASIINIRQLRYDGANNTRVCAADFQYDNQPPFELLLPLIGNDLTCAASFTYKIEPLLDQPDRFYVSWRCSR